MTVTAVAPAEAGVKVGDFFVASWGYDQTNIDFYKVVGLTAKGVKIQKWSSAVARESAHAEYVVPGESPATKVIWPEGCEAMDYWERQEAKQVVPVEVKTKRLQSYDGGKSAYIRLTSYSSASLWDGRARYETPANMGH